MFIDKKIPILKSLTARKSPPPMIKNCKKMDEIPMTLKKQSFQNIKDIYPKFGDIFE